MKRRMRHTWCGATLALSVLGAEADAAQKPVVQATRAVWNGQTSGVRTEVVGFHGADSNQVEVSSTRGFEPGAWVLVQPTDDDAAASWQLMQVQGLGEQRLELSRPLPGHARTARMQVRVLAVSQEPEWSATAWLDTPREGARVSGGVLPVEGRAPRDSQVLIFVDGVEAARLSADSTGRFEGTVELPPGAGSHQLRVISGSEEDWRLQPEPVALENLAPPPDPVVLEPVDGGYTNDTTPLFRGTAQPGTKVFVTISGSEVGSADVNASGEWSLVLTSALAEGTYPVSVRAQSSGGEASGLVSFSFTVDTTRPTVSFVGALNGSITGSTTVRARFTGNGEAGTYYCSLDGSEFTRCTSPRDLTGLADGPHVFRVRMTDLAGNESENPAEARFVVDTTPPVLTIKEAPPVWSRETSTLIVLESSEASVDYECTLDGTVVSGCSAATGLFNLSEGPHTFKARALDEVNNVGAEVSYTWNVDLTPPTVPSLQQPIAGALLNSPSLDISGKAEPGGTVRVLLKGRESCTATADASGSWTCRTTSALTTDSYELDLQVQDAAGNVNDQFESISFRVDVDTPDTFIDVPDTFIMGGPEAVTQSASPKFSFRSNESDVTFECSVGDEAFGLCDEIVNGARSFDLGRNSLRVRARDRAGNVDDTPAAETWVYSPYESSGGGLSGCSASGAAPLLPLIPLLALPKRRRSRSFRREVAGGSALLALLMVFQVGSVRAQGVDLQQYKPAPGSRDVLGVYSPQVAPGTGLHAGLSVSYARNPLVLRTTSDGNFAQSIVSDQVTADVLASISFLDHFELGLALPVTGQWGPAPGNLGVFIPENTTGTGLGDLRLVPKVVLPLGEALSLGAAAVVSLPTANGQSFLGTGGVGVQPMLLAQWAASQQLRVLANVGGRFQPANQVPLLRLNVGNELAYALGAHWSGSDSKLFVQGSLEGAVALSNAQSSASPLELLAAVGYSLPGGMTVQLGGGPGLTSGYGTPNFRLFARLDWASGGPAPSCTGKAGLDDDKDGVLNVGDLCPYEEGDRGDGCPKDASAERVKAVAQLFKSDSDNDGIPNDEDACPNIAGERQRHGCPMPAPTPGKQSESKMVTFTSLRGKTETDYPPALETVVNRAQELLKDGQLEAVRMRFAPLPKDKKNKEEAELMRQRADHVHGYLAKKLPAEMLKVEFNGKPIRPIGRTKDELDVEFILVYAPKSVQQPQAELTCADQGVAARLMSSHGEVTAGAENMLKALANEDKVCDGDLVKTGPAAGAVLVLSEGNVLRLAPESQVRLSRKGIQLLQGTAEPGWNQAALAAPEILRPCKGSSPRPATISWQKVPGARKYWVQAARGADFNSDVRFVLTENTVVALELPSGGKWYWRVLPVDEKNLAGQPSKIHSFEADEAAAVSWRN